MDGLLWAWAYVLAKVVQSDSTVRRLPVSWAFASPPLVFYCIFLYLSGFVRCSKEVYGVSITEYIQQRRLSHAETLLSLTDFTIEQVAAAVGYNNAGRFASMFKKSTGVYPAEYRKMAQKK